MADVDLERGRFMVNLQIFSFVVVFSIYFSVYVHLFFSLLYFDVLSQTQSLPLYLAVWKVSVLFGKSVTQSLAGYVILD